ncbi:MAG: hypothetical protein LC115_09325 [Bacteroidia bacterium]|nr:hypothetical protein [Bacteroidia bacterium]
MNIEPSLEEKIEQLEIKVRMQQQELLHSAKQIQHQLTPEVIGYKIGRWLKEKLQHYRWLYWVGGGIAILMIIRTIIITFFSPKNRLTQTGRQQIIRYASNPPWWLNIISRAIQVVILNYLRKRLVQFLNSRS